MRTFKYQEKISNFLKGIDKEIIFSAIVATLAICYYINPLNHVDLTDWNRTFSTSILSGISIDKRVNNFYTLFLVCIPILFIATTCIYNWILKLRDSYKESYFKINIILLFGIVISYISRYAKGTEEIINNHLIETVFMFQIILFFIAILDKHQVLSFTNHVVVLTGYMVSVISSNILLRIGLLNSILIISVLIIGYVTFLLYTPFGKKLAKQCQNLICLLLWTPAFIRLLLECIYFLTEKGRMIKNYYTIICVVSLIFVFLCFFIIWITRKKEYNFISFGYIGAIVSLGALSFFSYSYQYVWSYANMPQVYEFGNRAVAMDTILYGKVPIIDYFSSHALDDVWTEIIYCFIHSDIKGIFVGPYRGLSTILACFCLYYIVKKLFDRDIAVLFVCLFPTVTYGIKISSLCCISIVLLLHIVEKPSFKAYIGFWSTVLLSAFITYDEGISLGIASIFAYIILVIVQKKWKNLRSFIIGGVSVGFAALVLYSIYGMAIGMNLASRIKEWLAVSAGSNSSWATASFGDTSSFAFLLSYFVVPVCAVIVLVLTIVKFIRGKKFPILATVTIAFALTEILYITRTIVFHNLAVCSGTTGVLLNFIHWTLALYALYSTSIKDYTEVKKLLVWTGVMGAVILAEGTLVTGVLPTTNSVIYAKAVGNSEKWDLKNDTTENWDKDRIIFDESTVAFVNQFETIFDILLLEDQTFLDFANITSIYALTERVRPFYVGQSPSSLTDLYSQECYLDEITEYDCPLAILGTTDTSYVQHMFGIPHNVRYYKIAEYIYSNYRPLVCFGEFVIWCDKDSYNEFYSKLNQPNIIEAGYILVDYGYDATTSYMDENGNIQYQFQPYHSYDLELIPYIWANYDDYEAINNHEILKLAEINNEKYSFSGSQTTVNSNGNYLAFECSNAFDDSISGVVVFQDSSNEGIRFQYNFTVVPGTASYMIRVSGDYFWDAYNVDTITFLSDKEIHVDNVRILEGD